MNRLELLKELAAGLGISGFETEISEIMKSELAPLAPFKKDNLGSIAFVENLDDRALAEIMSSG